MYLPHFTPALLLRTLAAWAVLRAAVGGGSVAAGAALGHPPLPHPLWLSPGAAMLIVAFAAAVGWLHVRRNRQELLLANLAIGRGRIVSTIALPLVALELAIGVAARL